MIAASYEASTHDIAPIQHAAARRCLRYLPALAMALTLVRFRVRIFRAPLPLNDFLFYWTGAKLFLSHADPYSMGAMFAMERGLGWHYEPVALLYPPWVLPLIAGFGIFPFSAIHIFWRMACVGIECGTAITLWRYFGGSARSAWIALAVLITFLPAASAEQMGQLTPLMLGGVTVLLLLLRRGAHGFAGAMLLVMGLKPHLVYLLVAAVVLWAFQEKHWRLMAGGATAFAVSAGASIAFNPKALGYFHSAHPALGIACGTGFLLRVAFGMQHAWLQFVPTLLGGGWFAVHWLRHRRNWQWEEQAPLLMVMSLVTAPYSWAHDYVLALPAMLALGVRLKQAESDWLQPAAMYLVVQLVIFSYLQDAYKPLQSLASALWLALYLLAKPAAISSERPEPQLSMADAEIAAAMQG